MTIYRVFLVFFVLQFVIHPVFALDSTQTQTINDMAAALNMSNATLLDFFSSMENSTTIINVTQNNTVINNYTMNLSAYADRTEVKLLLQNKTEYFLNGTQIEELVSNESSVLANISYALTMNDTSKMLGSIVSTVDDRFEKIPRFYVRREVLEKNLTHFKNETNENLLNWSINTQTYLNTQLTRQTSWIQILAFLFVISVALSGYTIYSTSKKASVADTSVRKVLPKFGFEKHSIDDIDSSKSFRERILSIGRMRLNIAKKKLPDNIKERVMQKLDAGMVKDDHELKQAIEEAKLDEQDTRDSKTGKQAPGKSGQAKRRKKQK